MSTSIELGMRARLVKRLNALVRCIPGCVVLAWVTLQPATAQVVPLADRPLLSNPAIPGNLVLPLSVEFPTGISPAHTGPYDTTRRRLGYFDPGKCYTYVYNADETQRYFQPAATPTGLACTGMWSGNFLNWATMQTIDPFRWALTGGNRVIDTETMTVLQKAVASNQGNLGTLPDRNIGAAYVPGATPFGAWTQFNSRTWSQGVRMRFTSTGNIGQVPTVYQGGAVDPAGVYELSVRVRVCDANAPGGVEANCRRYGTAPNYSYKPEGLIQQYSDRIRYSAFGYLNDSRIERDAGVLRARQKFVAPQRPRPGLPSEANPYQEWRADTGQLIANPDNPLNPDPGVPAVDAYGVAVTNSGVINYLNKFGQTGSYKGYDPVSELYYAALRYLRNLGNVPAWTDAGGADAATRAAWADGFPVITDWRDPILYSCQANFILGIGDVNTHADKNVPGNTPRAQEPTKPGDVTVVGTADALLRTNEIGVIEGIGGGALGSINPYNACCNNNSALMAGLAYDAHINDIRPDLPDIPRKQTVKTFWVDVLEGVQYRKNNQYYLATKYGGFAVPDNYDPASTGPNGPAAVFGNPANWNANGQTLDVGNATSALTTGTNIDNGGWGAGVNRRPDTYFTAGTPDTLVAGLTAAFNAIGNDITAVTTSFALESPFVNTVPNGNVSYSANYSSGSWTGSLSASRLTVTADGATSFARAWSADGTNPNNPADTTYGTFNRQLAGDGWSSATGRRVITFNGTAGVPFRAPSLGPSITPAQFAALDTPYGAGPDSAEYLNYLRGDRSNEVGAAGALGYRSRTFPVIGTNLLGDIANSKVTALGAPNSRYSDAANPGYAQFVADEADRRKMVFVGANDGMLHAFNGEANIALGGGREVFAYVPSALFNGPTLPAANITQATRATDALTSRGNPTFEHKALVDATAEVFDIDFARAGAAIEGNPDAQWRSVLIGGLGKGGRSYYAINVSARGAPTPIVTAADDTEANWAGRVLWEFPNANTPAEAVSRMGFSYGKPLVTKTARWGWVVVLPSGYNNASGGGFLFFVDPRNGALLDTVELGSSGLANVQGYKRDSADNTAESIYAADLEGNVWRVDVTGTEDYVATRIAELNSGAGADQSVTTRLLVEIDPASGRRYVLVGTGRLLDTTEIANVTPQTFYAIVDGTRARYDPGNTVVTRDNLVLNNTASLTGAGITPTADRSRGWFLEFGRGADNVAWRLILDPITNAGRVSFATLLPTTGDPCASGQSRTYSIDIGTGASVLLNNTIGYIERSTPVIDIRYLCIGSTCRLYTGTQGSSGSGGGSSNVDRNDTTNLPVPGLRRLNWRELQIVQ